MSDSDSDSDYSNEGSEEEDDSEEDDSEEDDSEEDDSEEDSSAATDSEEIDESTLRVKKNTIGDAIKNGCTDVIKRFLNRGLNPNTLVDDSPILMLAIRSHRYDIVRLLLEKGANPNIEYPFSDRTAIFASEDPNIIDMLIRYGADVNKKIDNGDTPLSYFVLRGNIPVIKLLVSRGADLNATDNEGKTPLTKASNVKVAELLLKLGADPNIKDNHGKKASDHTKTGRKKSTLQMAEKRFSKKSLLPPKYGRTTPHWMEICNTLGDAGVYDLKKLIVDNVDYLNYDFVAQFFTSSPFNDVFEFLDYIQGLSKREICAGLAKYYTATKPGFLSVEYVRANVRPISEMARKSIQSKRKKASLYSLAYRKARQSDPEKFREYVSRFDLPSL
jgi:ankyrin repeat protein